MRTMQFLGIESTSTFYDLLMNMHNIHIYDDDNDDGDAGDGDDGDDDEAVKAFLLNTGFHRSAASSSSPPSSS